MGQTESEWLELEGIIKGRLLPLPAARDSPQRLGPPSPAWLCNQPPTPPQSPCAPGGLRHAMPAPLRYRALILLGHGLRAKAYYSVNDPALSSGDLGQRLHAN